jgi:Do/DeqQ family serine protease
MPAGTSRFARTRNALAVAGLIAASACAGAALARGPATASAADALPSSTIIADVSERAVDSVVSISTTSRRASAPVWSPFDGFGWGGGDLDDEPLQRRGGRGAPVASLGSGVIVSGDGRVLTNAHVVASATDILVGLPDGDEVPAKVVGLDEQSDLAVLQLEGDLPTLRPMPIADSDALRLGEVVLAIGNPFGVGKTVTMGIVSAQGRSSVGIEDYEDFIQTDAAINPGNSGGALVNMKGELVGINTAILSRSGGSQGIGFAIPTDMAVPIMEALVKDGRVARGYLGIGVATVTKRMAAADKLPVDRGVLVDGDIAADSPAGKAGLRAGDVITAIDGEPATDAGKLRNTIAMRGQGAKVELEIVRGKTTKTVTATLGELPTRRVVRRAAP